MGFADPVANGWIDSVVRDRDGQLAIRFYVYKSSEENAQTWASTGNEKTSGNECDDDTRRKAFIINTERFAPEKFGRRVVRGEDFATLAHELLHPVILSSPFMDGHCVVGKWISEGISDAISFDIARSILASDMGKDTNFRKKVIYRMKSRFRDSIGAPNGAQKVFGLRLYWHPLHEPADGKAATKEVKINVSYGASSFWRYLAEIRYIKQRNPNDPYPNSRTNRGPGYSLVDYAYVVYLSIGKTNTIFT